MAHKNSNLSQYKMIEYLKSIKDLEIAIYTNRLLGEKYKKLFAEAISDEPKLQIIHTAVEPMHPLPFKRRRYASGFSIITGILFFLYTIFFIKSEGNPIGTLLTLGISLIGITDGFSIIKEDSDRFNEYTNSMLIYENNLEIYEQNLVSDREKNLEFKKQYDAEMEKYNQKKYYYYEKAENIQNQFDSVHKELTKALDLLYANDIIYPKYQNFLAVSAFYDYFASGRCDKLDGTNGAYNLFEKEYRQNVIIEQLASMSSNNPDVLKYSQKGLYDELNACRERVDKMITQIEDETIFVAYFTDISKILNSSKKLLNK